MSDGMDMTLDSDVSALQAQALRILTDLVAFPTVTSDSNLDLIAYAEVLLRDLGADVVVTHDPLQPKANLFATIGPICDGGVVLSGHTDVVPAEGAWTTPPFAADLRDGAVYGRGTADMKGFIACVLATAPGFAAAPLRLPVHIALTYDEEIGFNGAPVLLAELARTGPRPAAAIVGEPTAFGVIAGHKGCHEFTTTITGLEGHASAPAKGVNAVEEAGRYIARLLQLRDDLDARAPADSPYDPPGTTLNVGTINGGSARNILAGSCTLEWDLRPVQRADIEHVAAAMAAYEQQAIARIRRRDPHATIRTTTVAAVDGLEQVEGSPAVALAHVLLDDPSIDVVAFGTEAGLFQQAGIPAIVCGPGSIDVAHKPDEHLPVEQLDRCLQMLHRLMAHLCTDEPR
ncbi:acetylornithine deacetylase [soil metagenome]